jgi:hypothetical protein
VNTHSVNYIVIKKKQIPLLFLEISNAIETDVRASPSEVISLFLFDAIMIVNSP